MNETEIALKELMDATEGLKLMANEEWPEQPRPTVHPDDCRCGEEQQAIQGETDLTRECLRHQQWQDVLDAQQHSR
jgi:hypothetical protein